MIRAYCLRSGMIGFATRLPPEAFILARGPEDELRRFIQAAALKAGRNTNPYFVVPGVGAAETLAGKAAALDAWTKWAATKATPAVRLVPR